MVKWALALALTSLWTVAQDSPPLSIAPGNQDVFVADNRSFVQRLTARKIPYEYREVWPFGHSWEVWDPQLVNFVDVLSRAWSK